MTEPTFFTIRQGNGKQAGQNQARQSQQPPPPPPPNLRPAVQQQSRPHDSQVDNQMGIQMNNQVNDPNTFAYRGPIMPPTSQICDVSQDIMTEADKRETLTTYSAFRWEKIPEQTRHGVNGAMKSHWERAIRTEVKTMSQRDIVKEIRHLNRNTKTFVDKRKELDLALQRQIDKVQEELIFHDPGRGYFDWCVVQMDHQLREIPPHHSTSSTRHDANAADTYHLAHGRSSKRRTKSGVHPLYHTTQDPRQPYDAQRSKKRFERLALTVYFKREPKPTANVEWLYHAQRQQAGSLDAWSQSQNVMTSNNQQHQQQQQQQQQGQQWAANQGKPQDGKGQQQNGQQGQKQQKQQQKQLHHGVQILGKPAARKSVRRNSGSDSDSGSWSSDSSTSSWTAPSSQGRPPKMPIGSHGPQMSGAHPVVMVPGHNIARPMQIPLRRPEVHQNTSQHHGQYRPGSIPQASAPDTVLLDQVRNEAYLAGREHQRIVNAGLSSSQRLDSRPIAIQRPTTPQGVRHVRYADARDDLRNRRLTEYVDEYSGNESDDYGMSELSITDHSDRPGGGRRYRRDSNGHEYTSSPTRTQSSAFSEDPFVPRKAAYQGVSRGSGGGHHIIETARGGGHGAPFPDERNPFHPRPRSPRFYHS